MLSSRVPGLKHRLEREGEHWQPAAPPPRVVARDWRRRGEAQEKNEQILAQAKRNSACIRSIFQRLNQIQVCWKASLYFGYINDRIIPFLTYHI